MLLKNKKVLIMGIRNKWSIAWGAAISAYENGAEVIFTYNSADSGEKVQKLIEEIPGAKAYACDVSNDENIEECLKIILKEHGKIDGILHAIAHANTEDLRNDFIKTSRDGFAHAADVSSYSLVAVSRIAKDINMLNENSSIVSLTYYGSEKSIEGYNVMGVAKAALEASIRYLAENLGKDGIRVNAISAGPIKTLSSKGIKDFGSILSVVEERAPLKRNVDKEEVGDAVSFMLSKMSSAITGQVVFADCGYNIMGC